MLRVVLIVATLLYPFIVYFGSDRISPGLLAGLLAVLFVARALTVDAGNPNKPADTATSSPQASSHRTVLYAAWFTAVLVVVFAVWVWWSDYPFALRLYPLIVNLLMLIVFAHSLFNPPPLIERIAVRRNMPVSDYNRGYLRVLTQVWVGFFCINILISIWTIWFASMQTWLWYNGFVAYLVMGGLFVGEIIYRQFWEARYPESGSR